MAQSYAYAPETIIKAYALGLFPMAESHNSKEIRFYDPDMRGLIPIDSSLGNGLHIPRRLQRHGLHAREVLHLLGGVMRA